MADIDEMLALAERVEKLWEDLTDPPWDFVEPEPPAGAVDITGRDCRCEGGQPMVWCPMHDNIAEFVPLEHARAIADARSHAPALAAHVRHLAELLAYSREGVAHWTKCHADALSRAAAAEAERDEQKARVVALVEQYEAFGKDYNRLATEHETLRGLLGALVNNPVVSGMSANRTLRDDYKAARAALAKGGGK